MRHALTTLLVCSILARAQTPAPPPTPPGTVRLNPKDGLSYVWIPPGSFAMGCSKGDTECQGGATPGTHVVPDEKPAHPVTLTKGLWVGQTEVTQEAFQKITSKNPSRFVGPKHPVEQVTWAAAASYCKTLDMRLPTEAEWEYAARAGTDVPRYAEIDTIAWDQHNSGGQTKNVGQKVPNLWGLYDTLGNVAEWTSDWWSPYHPDTALDPTGPASGTSRITRGGSWDSPSFGIRASVRTRNSPAQGDAQTGFRCVSEH